ncbi:MAG TPA: DHA2 family efflux MFS transporter permease subunit [Bacillota bacterium]|nr:DHA2 family efflux MFS transporter permease subunit [Bacillota bacterium]
MKQSYWPQVFAILIGTFMAVLDTSIVNVAIPKMMNVFGVAPDEIQWVLTGYTLVMASVIPLTGFLGTRFGLKKVYLASFVMFTVGSLLCGVAWSNNTMIAARVVQALGGGLIMPVGQALLWHVVPMEKMGAAMGVFGISVMVAPAIGPTLSGMIVEYLDWHLIFTINVPIGVIGILIAMTFLQETPISEKKIPFDYLGFFYSTLMLVTFLLAVTKGEDKGWTSFYIVGLFSASLISGLIFLYHEYTTEHPLMDLRLFRIPTYTYGVLVGCFVMIGMFGAVYLIPIYAENLLGYTAMQTGILMFPQSLCSGVITLLSGSILMKKYGGKPLIILGLVLTVVNTIFLARIDENTTAGHIQLLMALRGLGLGFCMMPSMQLPLQVIAKKDTGNASALMNVTRQMAMSVGVAILTSIYMTQGTTHAVHLAETVNGTNPINTDFLAGQQQYYSALGFSSDTAYGLGINTVINLVKKYATLQAMDDTLLFSVIFIILSIPLTLLMKEPKIGKTEKSEQAHTVAEM